jgi:invasion protein IalB
MSLVRSEEGAPSGARRGTAWRAALAGVALLTASGGGAPLALAQDAGEAAPEAEAPATPALPAGPRDGKTLQDWTLHCRLPQPDREVCEMRQRIVDQNGNRVLLAVVGRLPNLDMPGLLLLLPLGIALPPGTSLKIDQGEAEQVEVERCERQGCRVELLLDDELLPRLKAGQQATVSFHVYDGQGQRPPVDVPISLLGFSAALAEVMK